MSQLPDDLHPYQPHYTSEKEYDELAWLAAQILKSPIALISLLKDKKYLIQSNLGLDSAAMPLIHSFFDQLSELENDRIFIVEDIRKNVRLRNNPLVVSEPHILFYAGISLNNSSGERIGRLCVMDRKPSKLTPDQVRALEALGNQAEKLWALKNIQVEFDTTKPLLEDDKKLLKNIIDATRREREEVQRERDVTLRSLKERVKELNCLYAIGNLNNAGLSIEEMLRRAVACLPQGWQFPGSTTASIKYNGRTYKSPDHKITPWIQRAKGKTAESKLLTITVAYHGNLPEPDRVVFLKEEQVLLEMICENLVLKINQILAGQHNELLLQSTEEGIYGIDQKGICTFINRAGAKMLGYSVEECLNTKIHDLIHYRKGSGEIYPETECPIYKAKSRKRGIHVEEEVFWRKDGSFFPVRYSSTPIRTDGRNQGAVIVFSDLTEKKEAENRLLSTERNFRALVENSAEGIVIFDVDANPIYVSPSINRILGYSEEEALNLTMAYLLHPDDRAGVEANMREVMENPGIPIKGPISRTRHKDGSWRWVEATVTNMLHVPGINGIVDNFRDVTLKMEAENELKQSEEKYRTIFNASPLPKLIYEIGSFKIIDVNQAAVNHFRFEKEEFVQKCLKDVLSPKDHQAFIKAHEDIDDKGKVQHFGVYNHRSKDRSLVQVDIYGNSIPYNEKDCMIVTCVDVTEKLRTQKLERLENELLGSSLKGTGDFFGLLTSYSKGLESLFPDLMVSILEVRGNKVWNLTSPSLPEEYVQAINGREIGLRAGSCGTAAFTKNRVIVEDIENDVLWGKYKQYALPHNLASCWSQPLIDSTGKVIATFANYYPYKKKPEQKELELFSRAASLVSVLLENYYNSKELKNSNERFELVTQTTNDAIYDWDVEKDLFYWGEGFYRMFGYPQFNFIYSLADWANMTHPIDKEKNQKEWDAFFSDKKRNRWTNEFRFRRNDGTYAYVREIGYLIRDKSGRPKRMIGSLRDVSDSIHAEIQKQLQHQIALSFTHEKSLSQTLREILVSLTNFGEFQTGEVWLVDSYNQRILLNSTYAKDDQVQVYFEESKEVRQFKNGQGLPGTVWKTLKEQVWNEIDSNKTFARRNAAEKAGLKSSFAFPLFYNDSPVGVLVFCSDRPINKNQRELKHLQVLKHFLGAEIKRKQQEEELNLFFQNAPEILAIVSDNGYFSKVNPAFCKLLGYSEEELTTTPFEQFIHPQDKEVTTSEYNETITGERQATNFINRYITKEGDYKWISWSSSSKIGEEDLVFAYGRDITAMKELQQLFETAAKLARVGSWEMSFKENEPDTLYWSSMVKEIFEVDQSFIPSLDGGREFYGEESEKIITEAVNNLINNGESFDLELLLTTAKGNSRWVRCIGESEILNGKCIKILGSIQDIHHRKMAELELLKSLEERNTILESIGDAFFAVDKDWIVTYWNKEAEKLLGTQRGEIVGRSLWDLYDDVRSLEFYTHYHEAVNSGKVVHFDEYYPHTDSWLEVSAYPSDKGLSVYVKDISIRKKSEEMIRQSNERFEKATEATNDAIWDFDVPKNHLFWGRGFKILFGYDPEQVQPSLDFWASLVHPDDQQRILEQINLYMTGTNESHWFQEYKFKKADDTYAHVVDRATFIRDVNGKVIRVVGAMTDISYRIEFEESLKRLNKQLENHARNLEISNAELEQFAYVASHDLQEPLRMVSSFMTQLEKKYGDQLDEKAHQYIHFAVDGAKRMRQIILDLLNFSRIGRTDEERVEINLNDLIDDFCLLRKRLIEEKSAIIVKNNLPVITSYKAPITQVFHNLLDNALKYSKVEVPPRITIEVVEETNGFWEFIIEDNGIGIDEEYYDKIFVIFQRLHGKNEYEGTGMGLAIVKKVIENLGGRIWVESTRDNGSKFHFTLPSGK